MALIGVGFVALWFYLARNPDLMVDGHRRRRTPASRCGAPWPGRSSTGPPSAWPTSGPRPAWSSTPLMALYFMLWRARSTGRPAPQAAGRRSTPAAPPPRRTPGAVSTRVSQATPDELAVGPVDLERQALGLGPQRVGPEVDVLGRLERRSARHRSRAGLVAHVLEVLPQAPQARRRRPADRDRARRWPASSASMRSRAAIQLSNVPSHPIGVHRWKRMSPVNTMPSAGRCTTTSPGVWAGPT